jgi:hypothetical protein
MPNQPLIRRPIAAAPKRPRVAATPQPNTVGLQLAPGGDIVPAIPMSDPSRNVSAVEPAVSDPATALEVWLSHLSAEEKAELDRLFARELSAL